MKKNKEESPLKAARKKTTKLIQVRLAKLLKTITTELGQDELKPAIDVEKESKKLAKKIAKHLVNKEADKEKKETVKAAKETPTTSVAKKPVTEAKTSKEKPVSTPPVAKATKPIVVAAPVKNNAPAVKTVKTTAQKPVKK